MWGKIKNALTSRMAATSTSRTWNFDGQPVSSLQLGYQATFGFSWGTQSAPTEAGITIETTFSILSPGVLPVVVDPGKPETFAPLLALLHRAVDRVTAHSSGLLEITFSDGTVLHVPKRSDRYESWNTFGSGELHDFNMLCSSHEVAPWGR